MHRWLNRLTMVGDLIGSRCSDLSKTMASWLVLSAAPFILLGLTGCGSFGFSNYTTPQITGRVLAADTHQPLAGVKVIRLKPGQSPDAGSPHYGAELLLSARPEFTGPDGNFVLSGEKYVSLFYRPSDWGVRLAFQARHYLTLQTNCMGTNITGRLPSGEPQVQVGDILLESEPK